ncbi:MAG: FKBP-type peptidyl-prolyl cis-trans isomerase [Ilyomonas sp.]
MKRLKGLFVAITAITALVSVSSCLKSHSPCQPLKPSSEESQIVAYATANNINATKDSSGLYYQIIDSGTGVKPTITSKVFISYTGKFLNGTGFDQQSDPSKTGWTLSRLIQGWQIGLPLIRKGGHIKLIIPSALAYGCVGQGSIPPNEILFFDINLTDVQ